ncbi:MAG TPA: anthranilate phosphoribosyltransferase [Acidimicrobiia bacterium]|nr:anthranilate phosphoribosyltransferase [Acidimicrobiia bacterium]
MEPSVWSDALARLVRGEDLPADVVEQVMTAILSGDLTDVQIAGFAVALRSKGESAQELAALVRTMLRFAARVDVDLAGGPVVDTCGTGGDRSHTVNVSTMAALVAAGAGVRVAKHGNRAASSACGSADVFEALGVVIDLGPDGVARCIDEAGIGFCFAPRFHPAMRYAGPARAQLGVPTTFNFLGPLANPARVRRQVVGVPDPAMAERMLATLAQLGAERAMVFHGADGLDELTTTTVSDVLELRDGDVHRSVVDPADLGIARAERAALVGGDPAHNAEVVRRVLDGEPGPVRDVVVLNASAALVTAGVAADLAHGLDVARDAIDSGRAGSALDRFVKVSHATADAERG